MTFHSLHPSYPPTASCQPDLLVAPGDVLTSLDSQRLKAQISTKTRLAPIERVPFDPQVWRHAHWHSTRDATLKALAHSGAKQSRIDRFRQCGTRAWVYHHPTEQPHFRIHACCCGDRFCQPCARARAKIIQYNLAERIDPRIHRFATLTLRAADAPLSDTVTRLYQSFAALRRLTVWRQAVDGGAAFCEVTRGKLGKHWHVHLHLIIEGRYIRQADLKAAWLAVTGDSFVVDVRRIDSAHHVAHYLTKYLTKPITKAVTDDPPRFAEAVQALHRRRTCLTWGTWRGLKLTSPGQPDPSTPLCPLRELIMLARAGHRDSAAILTELCIGDPADWQAAESVQISRDCSTGLSPPNLRAKFDTS